MRAISLTLFLTFVACHTGNFEEHCNNDGSCNTPNLEYRWDGFCRTKLVSSSHPSCSYESECFCITCAEKCGEAGVKTCAYNDTSVWGSKPAVCECK